MSAYTPFPGPVSSAPDADENEWWLRREMSLIKNLLDEEGDQRRRRARRVPQDGAQSIRTRRVDADPIRAVPH